MFPNGITAMDDRVTASAFTASETTSSRRDTSEETETRPERRSPRRVVRNKSRRRRICHRRVDGLNIADKAEATLVQRSNEGLVVSVVAKRAPGAIDAAGERGLGDDPAVPDRLDQLILADNPVVVAHQMNDEIEYLGLDMHRCPKPAQLLLAEVDLEIGKSVF